jgi:hypothetical protein
MYRENSCLRLLFHKTERTSGGAETTARVRETRSVPPPLRCGFRQHTPRKLGPRWVKKPKDSSTGTKLGPKHGVLSLVFSVGSACKRLISPNWGTRGPEFKSRRPDQIPPFPTFSAKNPTLECPMGADTTTAFHNRHNTRKSLRLSAAARQFVVTISRGRSASRRL